MPKNIELNRTIKERLQDIEIALNESSIVAITNARGTIQFANEKFCELSKYSQEELIGSNQSIVNSGYHSREFFKEMWRTIGTGHVWKGEIRNKAKDGSYYWVDTTIVPFLKKDGKPYQYVSIRHDITKLKEYEATLSRRVFSDPLTLLLNRFYLNDWIENIGKETNETLTVFYIDIDRFKFINDTHGHRVGDLALKEVAKRLNACISSDDHLVIRHGGDEFVIVLKNLQTKEDILGKLAEVMKQFSEPFIIAGQPSPITISLGISKTKRLEKTEDPIQTLEMLITQADTAMYHAKKKPGNTYCFNTTEQNKEQSRYYLIENELRTALAKGEFSLVYQPIMKIETEEIVGLEALLRWNNQRLGPVSPAEFIPILEETGLIIDVGQWVLRTALQQIEIWHRAGMKIPRLAINVSPVQFKDPGFIQSLKKVIGETNCKTECLELEITEGTILHLREAEAILRELRSIGVRISIDDFGTGYSSLSLLKQLPINTLKIDKSFIQDLDNNGKVIVDTIISMGENLNFNLVAEGIESREQLTYLKETDCREGQGYYFSKPLKPEEIDQFYEKNKSSGKEVYYLY